MVVDAVRPLTAERWPDLERLFGPRGAYSGCWCMWWRLSGREFAADRRDERRASLHERARQDPPPGLLAYDAAGARVGWVAVAPREELGRLQRSPKLKPLDDRPVWSVTCFFVDRRHRGRGVAAALLAAAVEHAAAYGAEEVEGYPIDIRQRRADAGLFTGTLGLFTTAGFREVARRGGRPIVRRHVGGPTAPFPRA
jgi:GNAT superfamily N-acetyltransferase